MLDSSLWNNIVKYGLLVIIFRLSCNAGVNLNPNLQPGKREGLEGEQKKLGHKPYIRGGGRDIGAV